jgi:hypothetical protein
MGTERSLEKLHSILTESGLRITLTTLKNYSVKYDWQGRIRAADQATSARQDEERMASLMAMNQRQADLGYVAQSIAGRGLSNTFDRLNLDPNFRLTVSDSTRLMTEGSKLERLARGEVTDRTEARVHAYTIVVEQIVEVFAGIVRDHALPQGVIDDFIAGTDAVVNAALSEGSPGNE